MANVQDQLVTPTAAERPNFGTEGVRATKVRTNIFPITIRPENSVFIYDVSFKHPETGAEAAKWVDKRAVLAKAIEVFPADKRDTIAFDGSKYILSAWKLEFPKTDIVEGIQNMSLSGGNDQAALNVNWINRGRTVVTTVEFQFVRLETFSAKEVVNPLLTDRDTMSLQTLNIIMRHAVTKANRGFLENKRQFNADANTNRSLSNSISLQIPTDLPLGRVVSLGFTYSSHVQSGYQYRLTFDVATSAYYQEQSVLDFLEKTITKCPKNIWPRDICLTDEHRMKFDREIKRLNIRQRDNGIVHTVIGVTKLGANEMTFEKDGIATSVADFFASKGEPLRFPQLQCLHVGKKTGTVYIPMESADLLYQPCPKGRNKGEVDSQMIRKTCFPAAQRERMTGEMLDKSGLIDNPILKAFGIRIRPEPLLAPARILQPPGLLYKVKTPKGSQLVTIRPKDGQWKLTREEFEQGAEVKNWSLISFHSKNKQLQIENFCKRLVEMANSCGLTMRGEGEWPDQVRYCRYPEDLLSAVKSCLNESEKKRPGVNIDFILVCLDIDKDDPKYGEVKRVGDTVVGVMTQCVGPKVLFGATDQMLSGLVSKLNVKMNGTNSRIDPRDLVNKIFSKPTLVMGLDVIHPGFLEIHPSIATAVGMRDMRSNPVYSDSKCQDRGEEHIKLADVTLAMIHRYRDVTGALPQVILVFRDGMDDGKFAKALTGELNDIKIGCRSEPNYNPKITYIVVKKRHRVRIYPNSPGDVCGKYGNVPPGTVIDSHITHPSGFDLYLCAHYGAMGTSKMAHYHVLYDENNLTADEVQKICYQQCYLVDARCTKANSIPAPVKWADDECSKAMSRLVAHESSEAGSVNNNDTNTSLEAMTSAIQIHENLRDRAHFV